MNILIILFKFFFVKIMSKIRIFVKRFYNKVMSMIILLMYRVVFEGLEVKDVLFDDLL